MSGATTNADFVNLSPYGMPIRVVPPERSQELVAKQTDCFLWIRSNPRAIESRRATIRSMQFCKTPTPTKR